MPMIDAIVKPHLPVSDASTSGSVVPNFAGESDASGFDFSEHLANSMQESSTAAARQLMFKPTTSVERVFHAKPAKLDVSIDKNDACRLSDNSDTTVSARPTKSDEPSDTAETEPAAEDETTDEEQTVALGTPPAELLAALASTEDLTTEGLANIVTSTEDLGTGGPPKSLVATLTKDIAPQIVANQTETIASVGELTTTPGEVVSAAHVSASGPVDPSLNIDQLSQVAAGNQATIPLTPVTAVSTQDGEVQGIGLGLGASETTSDSADNEPKTSSRDFLARPGTLNPLTLGVTETEDSAQQDEKSSPDGHSRESHPEAGFGVGHLQGDSRSSETAPTTHLRGHETQIDPSRLLSDVSQSIQSFQQTGGNVRIKLHPPELGALQIDVSLKNGAVSARLEAQSTAAHRALTENLSQLHEALTQLGVTVDRVDVLLADQRPGDNRQTFSDRSFQGNTSSDRDQSGNQGFGSNNEPQQERPRNEEAPNAPHIRNRQPIKQLDIKV